MVTYFELALVIIAVLLIQASQWKPNGLLHGAFGTQGQMVQALAVVLSIGTLFFAWRWPLPQIMHWILGGTTPWAVRRRFLGSIALGYLFFGAYQALAIWLIAGESFFGGAIQQQGSREQAAFMWSLLPVWPLFIVFWVVFQGTGLALRPRSWMTRGLFSLFKATMWRLAEYNKGAVAAIALVVTIVLTVLKLQLS